MDSQLLLKIGYYSIFESKSASGTKYTIDNGKTLFIKRFNKIIANPYRDVKDFNNLDKAKKYIEKKLQKKYKDKKKKIDKLPKSLYLILMKEESTGKTFVKVGITSKRYISRRFSKEYGYEGYVLETILRRIDTPNAERLEKEIKNALNKKITIKKYRPVLECFSGYSECYNYLCIDEIIKIFDEIINKN